MVILRSYSEQSDSTGGTKTYKSGDKHLRNDLETDHNSDELFASRVPKDLI